MFLARVVGSVVATRKDPKLEGGKLLLVVPVNPDGSRAPGGYQVAIDTVNAGFREVVLCVRGSSARMAEGMSDRPVDVAIVGIVDRADVDPGAD